MIKSVVMKNDTSRVLIFQDFLFPRRPHSKEFKLNIFPH